VLTERVLKQGIAADFLLNKYGRQQLALKTPNAEQSPLRTIQLDYHRQVRYSGILLFSHNVDGQSYGPPREK
jgi:hypothetical protein